MNLPEGTYLGSLCKRGHDWESTGKSIRYKNHGHCVECRGVKRVGFLTQSEKDRFMESVLVTDSCWIWTGYKNPKGYGRLTFRNKPGCLAHRISYGLFIGDIPDNLHVLHKCDNPSCVNPDHFFLGTNDDNMKDRSQKDRQAKGEKIPNSKLTENDVRQIRSLLESGSGSKEVSLEFGIARSQVLKIGNRSHWKHVS